MNITVINGSPKGDNSVTIQYVRYLEKTIPEFRVTEHRVAKEIIALERNPEKLAAVAESVRQADAVIWSVPAYHFTVCGQLVRFFELFDAAGHSAVLKDKPAGSVITSIHFFDNLVSNWVRMACEDRGMRFIDAMTPEMMDLMDPKKRKMIKRWGEEFLRSVGENETVMPRSNPEKRTVPEFHPATFVQKKKTGRNRVIVVAEVAGMSGNLSRMVESFRAMSSDRVDIVDIGTSGLRGGCLGCIHCGYENECTYKDGFSDWYTKNITSADSAVFAVDIKNRGWGSTWKFFHDRSFFTNHRQEFLGKQLGFIVSGPLADNPNFREELEARGEVWGGNNCGIVTDEADGSTVISGLETLANRIERNTATGYRKPMTYLGTGGMKIFRDFIYNEKFLFRMDHKSYKKTGIYDFPQKSWMFKLVNLIMIPLMNIAGFRKVFQKMIPLEMASPLRSIVGKSEASQKSPS